VWAKASSSLKSLAFLQFRKGRILKGWIVECIHLDPVQRGNELLSDLEFNLINLEEACATQNNLMQSVVKSLEKFNNTMYAQNEEMSRHHQKMEEIEAKK